MKKPKIQYPFTYDKLEQLQKTRNLLLLTGSRNLFLHRDSNSDFLIVSYAIPIVRLSPDDVITISAYGHNHTITRQADNLRLNLACSHIHKGWTIAGGSWKVPITLNQGSLILTQDQEKALDEASKIILTACLSVGGVVVYSFMHCFSEKEKRKHIDLLVLEDGKKKRRSILEKNLADKLRGILKPLNYNLSFTGNLSGLSGHERLSLLQEAF